MSYFDSYTAIKEHQTSQILMGKKPNHNNESEMAMHKRKGGKLEVYRQSDCSFLTLLA